MIRTIELFCGIGGFRVGLENIDNSPFETIWSNDLLPNQKKQTPSEIYIKNFGPKGHVNKDIYNIRTEEIPDHDLLTAGFPCQDYSVANSKGAKGIKGKKGVLWWEIYRVLEEKGNKRPSYLILENVDRLLRSPAHQKGRDFAIILASLKKLGYIVEWKVINSAEYGFPQRKKRVFIVGYHKNTGIFERSQKDPVGWLLKESIMSKAFPFTVDFNKKQVKNNIIQTIDENNIFDKTDILNISDLFNKNNKIEAFKDTGIIAGNSKNVIITSYSTKNEYNGHKKVLKDILMNEEDVDERFFVSESEISEWKEKKGSKKKKRVAKNGYEYNYSEGSMPLTQDIEGPSRTIVTEEGGRSPSRSKHLIKTRSGRYRRLTPVELERLSGFPDGYTEGLTDSQRGFLIGNALVTGIPKKLGEELLRKIEQ